MKRGIGWGMDVSGACIEMVHLATMKRRRPFSLPIPIPIPIADASHSPTVRRQRRDFKPV
jgi:hypothetical protein